MRMVQCQQHRLHIPSTNDQRPGGQHRLHGVHNDSTSHQTTVSQHFRNSAIPKSC